jgi:two-component system chemotaxis response regulator CheY
MAAQDDTYKDITVLIVEDEPTTRASIRSQLRQIGIQTILEAADGKAGLAELARTRPTLVLCDVHMKPVDGRQFLKMVRTVKVEWVKNIPIIFLTADANPDTVAFAKEFHVNGYLVKPISVNDLKTRIDAVLKTLDRSAEAQGL